MRASTETGSPIAGRVRTAVRRMPWRRPSAAVPNTEDPLWKHASESDRRIVGEALPYSMTGVARLLSLIDAVRHCVERDIRGAFVECGVWRGGSALAMILTLQEVGVADRDLYLYDTFEGMTPPTLRDVSSTEGAALDEWQAAQEDGRRPWSDVFGAEVFDEAGVQSLLRGTGYPPQRLQFVRGRVEATIPSTQPDEIALLRLDTDWYESTAHELKHLYPRLRNGGVLIVDDYGHWHGARDAVDEYFSRGPAKPLLTRVDYSARMGLKA
jgi:O-methyltransferase